MKVLVGFLTETAFCCALLYGIGFSSESPYSNNASVAVRSDLARDQADAEFVVRALEQCYAISEVAMVGKITSRSADINREAETILHDYTVITDSLKAAAAKKSLCVVLGSSEAGRALVLSLHKETPETFDAAWRSAVVSMNAQLLELFQNYPREPEGELQSVLRTSIPILRKHSDVFNSLIAEEHAEQERN